MLIETIRKHISTCDKSRYRISKDTNINEAVLCRIMQGKTCTLETANVLLMYFGLEIVSQEGGAENNAQNKEDIMAFIQPYII